MRPITYFFVGLVLVSVMQLMRYNTPIVRPAVRVDVIPAAVSPVAFENNVLKQERLELQRLQSVIDCKSANGSSVGGLTGCLSELMNNPSFSLAAKFHPKAACSKHGFCGGNGYCFLSKCFCAPGYSGFSCEIDTSHLLPRCSLLSDACFRHEVNGRMTISKERWQRASWAEEAWWSPDNAATSNEDNDNAQHTADLFHQYKYVPEIMGDVLEVGCGPFSQLKTILSMPGRNWHVDSVTLADPIIVMESKHKKSSFGTGKFVDGKGKSYPTVLLQVGAEELGSLFHDRFDTVIMQNVLEHVSNAYEVLESLYNVTKRGGRVILWEPTYTASWNGWKELEQPLVLDTSLPVVPEIPLESLKFVDGEHLLKVRSRAFDMIAHPIRASNAVFDHFVKKFKTLQQSNAPGRRGDSSFLMVGIKTDDTLHPWF